MVALLLPACSSSGPPAADVSATLTASTSPIEADLVVRGDLEGRPIDRRVFGTNVPAWLGPALLGNPDFQSLVKASGATLARMPGGSWSNYYDWSACEIGDAAECLWTSAARPTDFVDFMQATGMPGLWTVSINATAQSAAAAVAFFNGRIGDERVIGVDREGFDWGTVSKWAQLRAEHGNPDPQPIRLWEVGNEVYGGRPDTGGSECVDFGWEQVWTCSGASYVDGDDEHDGYLAIRAAMVAVDPTIEVGAVGVADPASWSDWGNEVIESAGDELDFYTVHQYGFDASPDGRDALSRPSAIWPDLIRDLRSSLGVVPIAVTEYNLISNEAGDTQRSMTRAVNALYMADTMGQLVEGGVVIANQWNLANGTTSSGTDYGMIDLDDLSVFPQYRALALWSTAGGSLLTIDGAPPDGTHVYPTVRDDGSLVLVMINLTAQGSSFTIAFDGFEAGFAGTVRSWRTPDLDSERLIADLPLTLETNGTGATTLTLSAWSLSTLEVTGVG